MNIVQLQDLLKGTPDARLQQEMSQPSGTIPQYLVLSEIVRRDKMRQSVQDQPKTTVAQDVMSQIPAPAIQPMQPQQEDQQMQQEQQPAEGYASGGFISPSAAMGNAGVRGFSPEAPKQPPSFGGSSGGPGLFTPNTAPQAPAPVTNVNASIPAPKPQFDGGQQNDMSSPSFYEQGAYANGGVIGLAKGGAASSDLASLIRREAQKLGISPEDLATAISYETGGTFDPAQQGPTTKWGKHIGLIQMGQPQREQYGYDPGGNLSDQMSAVGRYLKGRGVTPGMGMLDVYSAINAGAPGLGHKSDVAAGGAPGTVAEKVNEQMSGHREKAAALLAAQQGQGMAGRETTSGAGEGAGLSAIGVNPAQSYPTISSDTTGKPTDKSKVSAYQSMSKELGEALLKRSAPIEGPAAPEMVSGDPSLVAGIRRSPSQQLAEYIALRQGAGMASGGPVRMADGTPPQAFKPVGRGPTREQAEEIKKADERSQLESQAEGIRSLFETPASIAAAKAKLAELQGVPQTAVNPDISTPMNREWTPPAKFTQEEPAKGVFDEPEAPALPPTPTPEEDYISYLKQRDAEMGKLYEEQIKAEQERQAQSSGLPAFLKQMGLGMLGSSGNLRSSIQEGLANAVGSRETQGAEGRDRLRELQLKRRAGGIQSLEDIAKLKYETAVAQRNAQVAQAQKGELFPKDYFSLIGPLTAAVKDAYKAVADRDAANQTTTDPEKDPAVMEAKARLALVSGKAQIGATMNWDPATGNLVAAQ